jgi:hypothetical protein
LSPGTGSMVTDLIPATEPAKVTLPDAGAATGSPTTAAKSRPQCPAYCPAGEYPAMTGPLTGADRQIAEIAKTTSMLPPCAPTYR